MKKNILRITIIIAVPFTILFVSRGCLEREYIKLAGFTQGTSYHITYESRKGENLQEEIDTLLADFDKTFSIYLPGSVISRINRNDPDVIVNEHFVKVFNKAYEIYKSTQGAFDITVAPLVNAWGFGFTQAANVDSLMIDSLLQYVGMDKVELEGNKIRKKYKEIMLDCNAIAQGYAVDFIADYLDHKGIKNYLVEIGGEINTRGVNEKGIIWRIGIDKPIENSMIPGKNLQAVIQLHNRSLATSGNYRKFYEKDGVKYAHSIDPKTGYPVLSNLLSATVLAEVCMTADAYATAFMVMGLEKTKEFLLKHNELEAYLIYSDDQGNYRVFITDDLKKGIVD
jgi:thiamine biosynthesis lipoprotein